MLFHFLSSSQHDFSSHFLYNVIHFHKFNKMTKSQIYLLREGQTCVIIEEKLEEGDTMGKVQENKQQKRPVGRRIRPVFRAGTEQDQH